MKNNLEAKEYQKFVGIENYSTTTPPIKGRIKSNIADFIVREITPKGHVLNTYVTESPTNSNEYDPDYHYYTSFTLIKKKIDTIISIKKIQQFLGLDENDISFSGIKDKMAITAQGVSVRGDYKDKLLEFAKTNRHIDITDIKPSRKKNHEIGRLWGNRFSINLRNVNDSYENLKVNLHQWEKEIKEFGFPNYYGLQRFGKHRPNSHLIGKLIFQGDYKEAAEEFLITQYTTEYDDIQEFRRLLEESNDFENLYERCPNSLYYEKIMLKKLARFPTDYKRAIFCLPKSLLNLILSAYQSFLFNSVVSERMKRGDPIHKPVKGDLVSILHDKGGVPSLIVYKYKGGEGPVDHTIEKAFNYNRASVIAPIVGHDNKYKKFTYFGDMYDNLLESENFSNDNFKLNDRRLLKFYGTFRPINRLPIGLKVKQAQYTKKSNQGRELDPNGINLEFSLTKGVYATMLLRELQKFYLTELSDVPDITELSELSDLTDLTDLSNL